MRTDKDENVCNYCGAPKYIDGIDSYGSEVSEAFAGDPEDKMTHEERAARYMAEMEDFVRAGKIVFDCDEMRSTLQAKATVRTRAKERARAQSIRSAELGHSDV